MTGRPSQEYRKLLLAKHRKEATEIVRIIEPLAGCAEHRKARTPDLKAVNQLLETMPPAGSPAAEMWVGLFLNGRGQSAAARPYLRALCALPSHPRVAPRPRRQGAA